MRTRRLKDCKFEYYGDDNPTEIYITAHRERVYLYKPQALALLKFLLKWLPLSYRDYDELRAIISKKIMEKSK